MNRNCAIATAATLLAGSIGCAHSAMPLPAPIFRLARPTGTRSYVFTSTQATAAGSHRTRLTFTLVTQPGGDEVADITQYEHADGDAPFRVAQLADSCTKLMAAPAGTIVQFRVTPPPRDLAQLLPTCVPDDFWGAASDILPLLMIQVQPQFRARELHHAGDRLRFVGYDTRWKMPTTMLDQRIRADSGTIRMDSLSSTEAVITWDTSPMTVDLVRRLPTGQNALLHGREWFVARLHVDAVTGELLEAGTVADSLVLRMRVPYAADTLPIVADEGPIPVNIIRHLELVRAPDEHRHSGGAAGEVPHSNQSWAIACDITSPPATQSQDPRVRP